MSQVRFCVLGPLRAWHDDHELSLGSPQQQVVLAVLLLREGRLVPTEELISALWGDDAPRAAAATVRTYLSRLRRLWREIHLPSLGIDSLGGGYRLRVPAGSLDLGLFTQAMAQARNAQRESDLAGAAIAWRASAEFWKGVPLAGLPGPFAQAQSARMLQTLTAAREDRLSLELDLGRHLDVIGELSALTVQDPLNEHVHEMLMLALHRSGRRTEALSIFDRIRGQLADELGVDPGPRLQAARAGILHQPAETTPTQRAQPILPTPRSPATPIMVAPHQLPADLPDFTGRDAILADLTTALLIKDTVPVVSIAGLGGIGKTALAVRAAHQVAGHFPDGQIFVQLNALGERPAAPFEVLDGLLRTFRGRDEYLPPTLAERAALWRSTMAGRRVLIVLDDVRDHAQIRDLLPSTPGAAVIVTGRRRLLELPGSHWNTLGALTLQEATTLLGRIAGTDRVTGEPDAARALIAACSGIPHAVRLVAARLVARPRWSLAQVVDRIRQEMQDPALGASDDCAAVGAPFERGYRKLDELQARAFRLLALVDGEGISVEASAAALELPEEQAEAVLESLANVHLIEAGARGWYRYHSLVRMFARHQTFAEDTEATGHNTLQRLVRYYSEHAQKALQALEPTPFVRKIDIHKTIFADRGSARAWLSRERKNAYATAHEAGRHSSVLSPESVDDLRRLGRVLRRFDASSTQPLAAHPDEVGPVIQHAEAG